MKTILVTGGTVFVSQAIAQYFSKRDYHVYVLNRNHRAQCPGVTLLEADRYNLGDMLRNYHFDMILDITAYNDKDINLLLDAVESFETYIFLSSSAVYPESAAQPFTEETIIGANKFWGKYGTDKIAAEAALLQRVPNTYILRPPYLYGPGNNVYREAFVFDCAMLDRPFYVPEDGSMKLQFFHVNDLCRFVEIILKKKPVTRIFNVGNKESISIRHWVDLCYQAAGKEAKVIHVFNEMEQRKYFSFYHYEYCLDVKKQYDLLSEITPIKEGLYESYQWYRFHSEKVNKKPYLEYIDQNMKLT